MKKENITIYIDGIKIGFKHAVDLLDLINEQIKYYSSRQVKPKINLIFLANSIQEYMAQWESIKLGDTVEYKPNRWYFNIFSYVSSDLTFIQSMPF